MARAGQKRTSSETDAEEAKVTVSKKQKKNSDMSPEDAILSKMMDLQVKRNSSSVSFANVMKTLKMHDRNTTWRNAWKALIDQELITPSTADNATPVFTSNYELTDTGMDRAGTEEQKEMKRLMEKPVKTTEEHHARIRKVCMNKRAVEIFDLLLKHGSHHRKELAATIGINDRGATFHYGLQQLKQLKFVVADPATKGNIILSDAAFLNPEDRPEPTPLDTEALAAAMDKIYGKEISKAEKAKLAKAEAQKSDKTKTGTKKAKKTKKAETPDEPDTEQTEGMAEDAGSKEDEVIDA